MNIKKLHDYILELKNLQNSTHGQIHESITRQLQSLEIFYDAVDEHFKSWHEYLIASRDIKYSKQMLKIWDMIGVLLET